MKLFILKIDRRFRLEDTYQSFIIAAENENEARQIACRDANSCISDINMMDQFDLKESPWLDDRYSSCEELIPNLCEPGVIMSDFLQQYG